MEILINNSLPRWLVDGLREITGQSQITDKFTHSTHSFVIKVNDMPDIIVDTDGVEIYLSSALTDVEIKQLPSPAAEIMNLLMLPMNGVLCGQLLIHTTESGITLKAILDSGYTREHGISQMYHEFLRRRRMFNALSGG